MDFIIVPIQPEHAKEEVYLQLTELARSLGMKPNKYVEGTEDEKYSLITEMLSAIIRKELQVVRPTKCTLDAACVCGSPAFYTDKVLGVVCCRCQAPRQ